MLILSRLVVAAREGLKSRRREKKEKNMFGDAFRHSVFHSPTSFSKILYIVSVCGFQYPMHCNASINT